MDAGQRAKAIIIQLETLHGSERLNPNLRVLTRADMIAGKAALDAARGMFPHPVWLALERRLSALNHWIAIREPIEPDF